MSKYLFLALALIFVVCLLPQAQDSDPAACLDKPVGTKLLKFQVTGSYFSGLTAQNIIQTLCAMGTSDLGVWNAYWNNNANLTTMKNDLMSYWNNFPQSSEAYTASLTNGQTSYMNAYGYTAQGDPSTLDQAFGNTYTTLTFYAGRNTTAGSGENSGRYEAGYVTSNDTQEVIINTSDGNGYRIYAYDTTTPIVLDMNGDGKLEASKGQWMPHNYFKDMAPMVAFDMNGDGFDELVEWVGPNDGLLVTCAPGEKITGKNLYGLALGFTNGYEQLSTLDVNKDSKLTGAELSTLKVWQDKNGNAVAEAGEITSVVDLGITEIAVTHVDLMSSFVQNGKTQVSWDWHPIMLLTKKNPK